MRDLILSEKACGSSMIFIVMLSEWTGFEWIGFTKTYCLDLLLDLSIIS